MSIAIPINRVNWRWAVPWVGMALCLAAFGLHLAHDTATARVASERLATEAATGPEPAKPHPSRPAMTVLVNDSKLKAAEIKPATVRLDQLPTEIGVTGRIEVNADRRIDIRPRAAGVVRDVHVVLGQKVKAGDRLVMIDSPDIGTARLNLRARQRELNTARIEEAWKSQVAETVAQLVPEIRKGVDPSELEKQFADKPLGVYRGSLIQAYTNFDIAAHEEEKTNGLRSKEVIGEHPVVVAKHTRQGLQATLYATIEQTKFDVAQENRLATQRVRLAESAVIDAAQRLRILGVSEDVKALLDQAAKADEVDVNEDVTAYLITAPFDGTVIQKTAVTSQKADPMDILFTVADLDTVWLTANIAESDLASLPSIKGGAIQFSANAYGSRIFSAKLLSVGAMVDPLTRMVPLLAETPNLDGSLKPGMFTRILLDSPRVETALTLPRSALVEIEGKKGVFVASKFETPAAEGQHAFAFQAVEFGRESGDRVVVKAGLKEGDEVIAAGAYLLKAELILQSQGGED